MESRKRVAEDAFSLPAASAADEAVDPNVLDFVWDGRHYGFEWRQVLVGASLDVLEWVARRSEAIYGFDVIALFQLAGIAYPKDADNTRFIKDTWGIGFPSKLKLLLHQNQAPPVAAGLVALQALHHWLTVDKRAVAQYQAARYVNDVVSKNLDRNVCIIANFHCFYNIGNSYEMVRRVYLRFFDSPAQLYNETQEMIFILMCRLGSVQDNTPTFCFVNLDQHTYQRNHMWGHVEQCREMYRAIWYYKSVTERVMPADSSHRYIVKKNPRFFNRKKLMKKCCAASGIAYTPTTANTPSRLDYVFDYFLWCYVMGREAVETHAKPPTYVKIY